MRSIALLFALVVGCGRAGTLSHATPQSEGDTDEVPFVLSDSGPTDEAPRRPSCAELERGVPAEWTSGEPVSPCGRPNPLGIASTHVEGYALLGRGHMLQYPVTSTGFLVPYDPMVRMFEGQTDDELRRLIAELVPVFTGFNGLDDVWKQIGLVRGDDGQYLGVTVMETPMGRGVTFGCAACHAGRLFGKPVLGLHNRRSRANHMFVMMKPLIEGLSANLFELGTGATSGEVAMWERVQRNMRYIRSAEPQALGLDTALSHTILSLALREADAWATRSETSHLAPRPNALEREPSDVKPATWWLTKYKNKWFSDGSLVSGNPAIASLLINEYGRGSDLHEVDAWIDDNPEKVAELTTAIFSMQAPSYFDFFSAESFDLDAAKRGERVFLARCARCHGTYEKGWSDAAVVARREQLATTEVRYFADTPLYDVGTDMKRATAISYLDEVNALALSQKHDLVLKTQPGYVPTPLVGIWARWPYFHNMSAPSLCAVLTRAELRPVSYRAGEEIDPQRDFDAACNGYPEVAPEHFTDVFDARLPGLGNGGHDEGIFLEGGEELLSAAEKLDLVRFLQTL